MNRIELITFLSKIRYRNYLENLTDDQLKSMYNLVLKYGYDFFYIN